MASISVLKVAARTRKKRVDHRPHYYYAIKVLHRGETGGLKVAGEGWSSDARIQGCECWVKKYACKTPARLYARLGPAALEGLLLQATVRRAALVLASIKVALASLGPETMCLH